MNKILSLGLGTLTLTGCVSVLPPQVVPDALYRMSNSSYQPNGSLLQLDQSITVFEPGGSGLLIGRDIVFEDESGALSLMSSAQWSDAASRLLQSLLLDRLLLRTPESTGLAIGDRAGAMTPVEMRWQIKDFVVGKSAAVADVRVTVMSARKRQILGQFDVRHTVPYSGKPDDQGVQALIEAARMVTNDVAVRLPEYVNQTELMAESSKR